MHRPQQGGHRGTPRRHAAAAGLLALALAANAAAEPVSFDSAAVPPTPLRHRLGVPGEPAARIGGELYRPDGRGPFAALVLLHDCGGRDPVQERAIAEPAKGAGFVVLAVDSFAGRGATQACAPGGGPPADRALDALGALTWLTRQGFVDAARIAVLGFGQGGEAALAAVAADGVGARHGHGFAAAVAYYPLCRTAPPIALLAPALVLVGDRDNWARVRACRQMAEERDPAHAPLVLRILSGARHGFDVPRPQATNFFGRRLEYDAAAAQAAEAAAFAFLRERLAR